MSILIISLPPGSPGPAAAYSYTLTADGHTAIRHASAAAALLPDAGRTGEVVVVVPARALSWQRVTLPQGALGTPARLRPVLEGLLEEQVLDDPGNLHFALEPDAAAGAPAWVAVCDRAWLRGHIQWLEAAGHAVSRIVPEFAPGAHGVPNERQIHVLGVPEDARLVLTLQGPGQAIAVLPLNAATLALGMRHDANDAPPRVLADPAMAGVAEQMAGRSVEIATIGQRSLAAARGSWNLAQLELASSGRTRALRSVGSAVNSFARAPQWRAARWALGIAVVAQIAGLNLWAFKERQALDAKQAGVRGILQQTFPGVKVIVDAPVQMEREVARLRQAAGSVSPRDLEPLMAAAGVALPQGQIPAQVDYTSPELKLGGIDLGPDELSAMNQRLRSDGFAADLQNRQIRIRALEGRP